MEDKNIEEDIKRNLRRGGVYAIIGGFCFLPGLCITIFAISSNSSEAYIAGGTLMTAGIAGLMDGINKIKSAKRAEKMIRELKRS